jgi:hypothetical protein
LAETDIKAEEGRGMMYIRGVYGIAMHTKDLVPTEEELAEIDVDIASEIRDALENVQKSIRETSSRDVFFLYMEVPCGIIGKEGEIRPLCTIIVTPYAAEKDDVWRAILVDYLKGLDIGITVEDKRYGENYAVCITGLAHDLDADQVIELFYPYAEILRAEAED